MAKSAANAKRFRDSRDEAAQKRAQADRRKQAAKAKKSKD